MHRRRGHDAGQKIFTYLCGFDQLKLSKNVTGSVFPIFFQMMCSIMPPNYFLLNEALREHGFKRTFSLLVALGNIDVLKKFQ